MTYFGKPEKHFERNKKMELLRGFVVILLVSVLITCLWVLAGASDFHQDDQQHHVVYTVTDSSGNPVSNQTVRLALKRTSDGFFYDFNDSTFKASGHTTRLVTMNYDAGGEYYGRVISIDQATIVSGEYVAIVSNDDATFGDQQVEVFEIGNLTDLIKIHR